MTADDTSSRPAAVNSVVGRAAQLVAERRAEPIPATSAAVAAKASGATKKDIANPPKSSKPDFVQ
ncbi:hypothetical protein MSS4_02228 [Mycobacterium marinum]|nr:hypothetical protein MSS4_02228 [Mycobacterium marinum]